MYQLFVYQLFSLLSLSRSYVTPDFNARIVVISKKSSFSFDGSDGVTCPNAWKTIAQGSKDKEGNGFYQHRKDEKSSETRTPIYCKMIDVTANTRVKIPSGGDEKTMFIKKTQDVTTTGVGKAEFNRLFAASKTRIFKFICDKCASSHREIYYKRLTGIENFDLYDNLYTSWKSTNNQRNVDFNMYSTYQDAMNNQNPWSFCNFNDEQGFPGECGPSSKTTGQWIDSRSLGGQYTWQIYFDSPDKSTKQWIAALGDKNTGKKVTYSDKWGDSDTNGVQDKCEGECDNDSDCAGDFTCFQRENGENVPGCKGTFNSNSYDYCYDVNWNINEDGNIEQKEFDAMYDAAPMPKIMQRICNDCTVSTHRELYYRRLTPVPKDVSMYNLFHTKWTSNSNVLGVDFDLYTTLSAAKVGRTKKLIDDGAPYPWWTYCSYDNDGSKNWGFPGDCGPISTALNQWTSLDNPNGQQYKISLETTTAVTKVECCTSYRFRSLDVGSGTELELSEVQLYEEADNSDTDTQAFNLGPDLEHGADYNQVAIVWDGFDTSNKAKNYVSFQVDQHLFVDTVDGSVGISHVSTNNDQARMWFDRDGGATFCRATSLNDGTQPGGSSWGVVPKDATDRTCGCHGLNDKGDGMFYGGVAEGCQQNGCGACGGGGWSGAVASLKPRGKEAHTGQMVQFWVRMASTDDMDTSSNIVPFNWVGGGKVSMIRYGVKEAGGLGCLQDGMPGCEVECSMKKGYTVGVAEQTADVRLPGGENFIELGNFRLGTTNNGDTFEIVHVSTRCTGCGNDPKVFNGVGKTVMKFNKDGTREESSLNQMGSKIELDCDGKYDCEGAAGESRYKPLSGLATITTSDTVYNNGNYYNIGYLFDGSSINHKYGNLYNSGTPVDCRTGDAKTCYWMGNAGSGEATITITFASDIEIGEIRVRGKANADSSSNLYVFSTTFFFHFFFLSFFFLFSAR